MLRQLEFAEKIQEAGRAILRHLVGVLTGEEDGMGEHIKRLTAVSPEKMAGLLKLAVEAIDRGVIIERRALGMDMIKGQVPNPAGGSLEPDRLGRRGTGQDAGLGDRAPRLRPAFTLIMSRHGDAPIR